MYRYIMYVDYHCPYIDFICVCFVFLDRFACWGLWVRHCCFCEVRTSLIISWSHKLLKKLTWNQVKLYTNFYLLENFKFLLRISVVNIWFWSRFLPVLSWYMKIVHNIRKIGVMNQYLFIVYKFQNQIHVHVDTYSVFVWLLSNFIDFGLHWIKCSKNNCYGLVIIQSCIWIWVLISLIQMFYMF